MLEEKSQENFQKKEDIGEKRFLNFIDKFEEKVTNINFTKLNCSWDVEFELAGRKFIGEIKVRNRKLDFFDKYPPYIELKKLKGILKSYKGDEIIVYINIAIDGIQIFEVRNMLEEYSWETKSLPKNSFQNIFEDKIVTVPFKEDLLILAKGNF